MSGVFQHNSYKIFVKSELAGDRWPAGTQSRLAEKLRCQTSFLSRVLNQSDHLTPEQALRCADFFGLSRAETDFFLTLLLRDRAGDAALRLHYERQIQEMREGQWNLSRLIPDQARLSEDAEKRYYSAWYYAAIHVAAGVPGLQSIDQIANRFHLAPGLVAGVLHFLETHGLIEQSDGRYHITERRLHLGSHSPLSAANHLNWRLKAIDLLQTTQERNNTHYSSILAISKDAILDLRQLMVRTIRQAETLLAIEGADELVVFNLDFFQL